MVVLTRSGWVVFYSRRHCGGRVWRVRKRPGGGGDQYDVNMQTQWGWTDWCEYTNQQEHAEAYYKSVTTGEPFVCPACEWEDADKQERQAAAAAAALPPSIADIIMTSTPPLAAAAPVVDAATATHDGILARLSQSDATPACMHLVL